MPVVIGDELKISNNRLNAYYDNLFRKLNVAKAWTNTTTTESGGTVSVINESNGIITNIECDYNNFYVDKYGYACVINGKIYIINNGQLTQIGSKSDWIKCGGYYYAIVDYFYGIDSSNKLYKISTSGSYTEIGSNIYWTDVCLGLAIGNGKLYKVDDTVTQLGSNSGWTKIIGNFYCGYGLCNGYVYYISSDTLTLMDTNDNYVDISSDSPSTSSSETLSLYALNSSGELYWNNTYNKLVKSNFNNGTIKHISNGSSANGDGCVVTTDGKLYKQKSPSSSTTQWEEIGSGIIWTSAISGKDNDVILAIGGGKLYSISGNQLTQLGSASGYKKLFGYNLFGDTSNRGVQLAWTGSATQTETTIYTTSNPQSGDKAYSDVNLTEYSTVQSCDGTTIADNFRTYVADTAKNGSFTSIPPAAAHETLKAIDLLRATE